MAGYSLQTFGGVILCGSLFGILGGWALGIVLRRHWLPDYLHNLATLAAVLGVFIASNRVMHESGLLAVTLMGMGLANMKGVDVRQILHFKENLSVLLISGLFILLAARLDINALLGLGPAALLVLLLIQFVARPLNVALSTWGSPLSWRERALLSWIARADRRRGGLGDLRHPPERRRPCPGGAAGAADLSGDHRHGGPAKRHRPPLARLLKVAEPSPSGYLIVGANPVGRAIGKALKSLGSRVLLTDSSWGKHPRRPHGQPAHLFRQSHLAARRSPPRPGRHRALLGVSPAGELNTLAAMRFRHEFGHRQLFRPADQPGSQAYRQAPLQRRTPWPPAASDR